MREVVNSHQDKKWFLRKAKEATAIVGAVVALTACDKPDITQGTIYKKEYQEKKIWQVLNFVGGKVPIQLPIERPENWRLYIAQCPTEEARPVDRIEKECQTESFDVPQEVFNSLQIGQHADFKQTK